MLVDGLPGESLTKTALRDALGDEKLLELAKEPQAGHGPWSHNDLLVAAQIDALRMILHVLVLANGGKSKPPEQWPRPGVKRARQQRISAEAYQHLQRLRAEHEALYGDTSGRNVISLPGASTEAG